MGLQKETLKTIVSVTPLAVLKDSRTFKIATSLSRFGYNSMVIEGKKSPSIKRALTFQLRSIIKKHEEKNLPFLFQEKLVMNKMGTRRFRTIRAIVRKCIDTLPNRIKTPLYFGYFLCLYFYNNCLLPFKSIPKASLYYLHSPYQFPAIYLLCWWYRIPFIYDAHDFYLKIEEDSHLSPLEKNWIFPFYEKIESYCMKKAAIIITVSHGISKLQLEYFGCKPIILRNCEDTRLIQEPNQSLKEYLGLNSTIFLLVTIGQAKKGQAIQEALKAMIELPEYVHLAFLGNNYELYINELESSDLAKRVHFVPPVYPDEVVPFIRSADASLILYYARSANYKHCLPNGLFQSIAAELPLLYPELPDISNIAKPLGLGIPINPKSPETIILAVKKMLKNPEEISKFKYNLKEAKQTLNWEQEEVILKEIITNVIDNTRR